MILLIDNYDSFSYNLYQLIGSIDSDMEVIRNDKITIEEIKDKNPKAIFLSPGPGHPKDAGICMEAIRSFRGKIPIFGVCLGHQAICEAYGGVVSYASELMHGKTSIAHINTESMIFQNMESDLQIARYHSLSAVPEELPECLKVIAKTEKGEIMAVEQKEDQVYGVQFHPESVLTPLGYCIIENFLNGIDKKQI